MNILRITFFAFSSMILAGCFSKTYLEERRLISANLSPDGQQFHLLMSEVDARWHRSPLSHNATRETLRAELWAVQMPAEIKRVSWQQLRATARNVYTGLDDSDFTKYQLIGDIVARKINARTRHNGEANGVLTRCRLHSDAPCEALRDLTLPASLDVKDYVMTPNLDSVIVSGQVYRFSDWQPGPSLASRPGFQHWQQAAENAFASPSGDIVWRQINADWLLAYGRYRGESDTLLALAYHLPNDQLQEIPIGSPLPKATLAVLDAQHDGAQWLFYLDACPYGKPKCRSEPMVYEATEQRLHAIPDRGLADPFAQRIWLPRKRQILLFDWLGERRGGAPTLQIRMFDY
jgi:hypothetical protein